MSIGQTEPQHRPMTVDDLQRLPDDGGRYELVDGRLDVSPAPVSVHTLIESRLSFHLTNVAPDDFMVLTGPGVNFNADRTHHRIPDVAVIRAEDFERPYLTRPPLLAVEVVSPESVFRDHHTKKREYAAFGIGSYWIINPSTDKPGIAELRLDNGEYREAAQVFGEETFETDLPFPVTLVPHWLIADGAWKSGIAGG
ncbi:Uma2 family endonuclease [Spinactinospora alkalitolerans]|uniref:Uma2 family endonuclease n=1 Tax=Spinactinospora alkalitolerans TaxID=687207 RepID=A0A852U7J4_9ACTN|nr:Uma2 family endonuclease [Spinactinospora alkalitolerans]NYE49890.1 Uma2 family endonuclease [Spinactinospora alkalitolerans]